MDEYAKEQRILEAVALKRGVSVETVRREIQFAAAEAMRACRESGNVAGLRFWEKTMGGRKSCSAEELLRALGEYTKKVQRDQGIYNG